jgi:hypothetical protein
MAQFPVEKKKIGTEFSKFFEDIIKYHVMRKQIPNKSCYHNYNCMMWRKTRAKYR